MPRGSRPPWRRPLGAVPVSDDTVEFRVWAPRAQSIEVELRGRRRGLEPVGDGVYEGALEGGHGDDYLLVLDGELELPDPCSRSQPHGPLGPSRIVDPGTFAWGDAGWQPPGVDALVLYELHVGTFSPEGTFAGVIGGGGGAGPFRRGTPPAPASPREGRCGIEQDATRARQAQSFAAVE